MDEYIVIGIRVIVAIIGMLLTRYIIPVLKAWYEDRVDERIKKVIKDAVECAEQTIKGSGMGTVKKEDVLKTVLEYLDKKGYNIDEKLINSWIEAAVFTMNNNKKES